MTFLQRWGGVSQGRWSPRLAWCGKAALKPLQKKCHLEYEQECGGVCPDAHERATQDEGNPHQPVCKEIGLSSLLFLPAPSFSTSFNLSKMLSTAECV